MVTFHIHVHVCNLKKYATSPPVKTWALDADSKPRANREQTESKPRENHEQIETKTDESRFLRGLLSFSFRFALETFSFGSESKPRWNESKTRWNRDSSVFVSICFWFVLGLILVCSRFVLGLLSVCCRHQGLRYFWGWGWHFFKLHTWTWIWTGTIQDWWRSYLVIQQR